MMPVVLLGGIYGGVMTPTEAAAVAAAYALLISVFLYRSIGPRDIYRSLLASARSSASIGMLIGGALAFNYVVTIENIPDTLRDLLAGYDLSAVEFLIVVNIVLLLLGCVLEGTAILLIIVPVFIPTAEALGIDMVHFGVVVVVNIMLGLITPPYGLLLFVTSGVTGVPLRAHRARGAAVPLCDDRVADAHHLRAGARAVAAAAVRLRGVTMSDDRPTDLHPEWPQPQSARDTRAGDLRPHDARRDRGAVPVRRRGARDRLPADELRRRACRLGP